MPEEKVQVSPVESQKDEPVLDEARLQMFLRQARQEQNLGRAILAGTGAAIVGAIVWALITHFTGFQIGWMAVGIGFIVAYTVRMVGQGIDKPFAIAGSVLALAGCILGNFLTSCIFIAEAQEMALTEVLRLGLNPPIFIEIMIASFSPMDLVFYGIAVYEGYRWSLRKITEEEIARLKK